MAPRPSLRFRLEGGGPRIGASAIVLGGGFGSRVGGEKLFLRIGGQPLLRLVLSRLLAFEELVVVASNREGARLAEAMFNGFGLSVPVRFLHDRRPGLGPLEGLVVGLSGCSFEWAFVVGCDMPWINEALVLELARRVLSDYDVLCCRVGGYLEPLHAFYRKSCASKADEALRRGDRKLTSFYGDVRVGVVEEKEVVHLPDHNSSFRSINVPQDAMDCLFRLWLSSPWA